jgi:hypothetical protein
MLTAGSYLKKHFYSSGTGSKISLSVCHAQFLGTKTLAYFTSPLVMSKKIHDIDYRVSLQNIFLHH